MKVQWNPLSQQYAHGRLLGYRVYFREYTSRYYYYSYLGKSVNTSGANVAMAILRDLKEATTYQIAVAAFTSKGEGPHSNWMPTATGNTDFFVEDTYCVICVVTATTLITVTFHYHRLKLNEIKMSKDPKTLIYKLAPLSTF